MGEEVIQGTVDEVASSPNFMKKRRSWIMRVLIQIDKFFNLYKGDPDETISETMGRLRHSGESSRVTDVLCDQLDVIDPDHCDQTFDEIAHPTPKEAVKKILKKARGHSTS